MMTKTITESEWFQFGINAITNVGIEKVFWLGVSGDPRGSPDYPMFTEYTPTHFKTIEEAIELSKYVSSYGYRWDAKKPITYVAKKVKKIITTEVYEEDIEV